VTTGRTFALPELPPVVTEVVERVLGMAGVRAVVLGGSRVNGTATEDSDWDLGIYYRQPLDLEPLRALGEVHPPGSWGRLMNGGAWLTRDGLRIDALLRDLDAVEHWTAEARDGRYEVDGLLGYLAGMPTYTLTAEVACSVVVDGSLDVPGNYPEALIRSAPERWRFHRDFSLRYARRAATLGNQVGAVGQLARATIEEAHARHCERGSWVLNEKRIVDDAGLSDLVSRVNLGADVATLVAEAAERLTARAPDEARPPAG
jgi:hypothetical protein